MANVRLRCTITWTYEADPKHYGISDPRKMAAIDMNNDIELLLDIGLNEPDFNMTIEPLKEITNGSAKDEK